MTMKNWRSRALGATAIGLALSTPSLAQDAQFVFLVDESGSMAGEQTFLQTFVPQLNAQLISAGSTVNQFGLVGYGDANVVPRQILVGGVPLGSAADFAAAAGTLTTSGGTEDGYAAVNFALNNYSLANGPGTNRVFVLVTDEDRDDTQAGLTAATIQMALQNANVALAGILDQSMVDQSGQAAVGASSTQTFTDANGDGVFEVSTAPNFTNAAGATFADYTTLILGSNGCVGDLNLLRNGGTDADAFAGALASCLVQIVVGLSPTEEILDGASKYILLASRDTLYQINTNFNSQIALRLTGLLRGPDIRDSAGAGMALGYAGEEGPFGSSGAAMTLGSPNGTSSFYNRNGLRAFVSMQGTAGSYDYGGEGEDFRLDTFSALAGIDYTIAPKTIIGIAAGFATGDSEEDGKSSAVETDAYSFAAYGSMPIATNGYMDGILSYNHADFDTVRENSQSNATAENEGDAYGARVEAGYIYNFGSMTEMIPSVELAYTGLDIDGFAEREEEGAAYGDQSYDIFGVTPKVTLSKGFVRETFTVTPVATAGVRFNFGDLDETIGATSLASGNELVNFDLPKIDEITGIAQLGVAFNRNDNRLTARLDYQASLSDDHQEHAFTGRLRFNF